MRTREFNALKVGDKVIVSGRMSSQNFTGLRGVIVTPHVYDPKDYRRVRFDKPYTGGHTFDKREWCFTADQVYNFNITVERETVEAPAAPAKPKAAPAAKARPHGKQEYKGNGKHTWEDVTDGTERLRVPGGWLYIVDSEDCASPSMTFVPAPEVIGYAI